MNSAIRILCTTIAIQLAVAIAAGCASSAEQQAQRQRATEVAAAQRRDAEARSSQIEANMRTTLGTYIIGTTTFEQFHTDRNQGDWQILQVKGQLIQDKDLKVLKNSPIYIIGTTVRAVCEIAFEGDATKVLLKAVSCK